MTDLSGRGVQSGPRATPFDASEQMNHHYRLALPGAVIAGLLLLPLGIFAMADALNEGEIAPNVTAAGVHIGGMSPEDALQALRARERALRQSPAPFTVQETDFDLDPRLLALEMDEESAVEMALTCLLYTSPSPRDRTRSRMPSSA